MDEDLQRLLCTRQYNQAFEALLDRYQTKAFRLVFSIIGNPAQAEDVTQDVFLKIWQALRNYDGRASLSTWIYTIARNTSISWLRAQAYRTTSPLDHVPEPFAEDEPTLTRIEIERLLAQLPEGQREVVVLFYLQERSIEDVAAMLDFPEGTVKNYLYRARKSMAAIMEVKQ